MGWSSVARQAAAAEYGRQNWRRYAARRQTGAALIVGGLLFAGAVGGVAQHWQPGWTPWVIVGGVLAVPVLFLTAVLARVNRR